MNQLQQDNKAKNVVYSTSADFYFRRSALGDDGLRTVSWFLLGYNYCGYILLICHGTCQR